MDIALSIAAFLFSITGIVGCIVPIIPGVALSYAGLLCASFCSYSEISSATLWIWLAVTVAKGEPVWNMTTRQGTTLYLCLEDSVLRIQNRLFEITEDAPSSVHFCTECDLIGQALFF